VSAEMKRRWWQTVRKALLWTLAVVVALSIVTWAVLHADSVVQRKRAERLLQSLRQLQPGEATVADAKALAKPYLDKRLGPDTPCSADDCVLEAWVYPSRLSGLRLRFPDALGRFGIHEWNVRTFITVREGKVVHTNTGVYVESSEDNPKRWSFSQIQYWAVPPEFERENLEQNRHYFPTRFPKSFTVWVTPAALSTDIDKAFTVDFDCFNRFGSCSTSAEVLPLAWRDYEARDAFKK
jgi:hypothetical protein